MDRESYWSRSAKGSKQSVMIVQFEECVPLLFLPCPTTGYQHPVCFGLFLHLWYDIYWWWNKSHVVSVIPLLGWPYKSFSLCAFNFFNLKLKMLGCNKVQQLIDLCIVKQSKAYYLEMHGLSSDIQNLNNSMHMHTKMSSAGRQTRRIQTFYPPTDMPNK